jgi:hypothetical protein
MSLQKVTYGFTPTSITGCQLWLDGTDPAGNRVIPASGTLSTWIDKSGVGNNAIAYTGATAPSFSSATNSITFGTNYYYIAGISSAPSAQTLFMVLRRTTSSWNTPYGSSVVSGATWYMDNANPTFIAWNPFGQGNSSGANLLFYNNITNVVCGTNNGGTNIMYLNGTADTAGSTSFSSSGIMTIGTSSSGTNGAPTQTGFIGTISEVIFYNSVLGTTQRQQVEGYLAQKWGATSSLVAGHPGRGTTFYRADYQKTNIMKAVPYFTQFSPRQIAGCSHWFDATDSSTITLSSGSLTQWNDKSGNGRNLTAVAGFANATVSSAFQNRLNVFNFSGNGLYRTSAGNVSYPLDVYIIVALKSLTTHVDVLGMGDTSTDNFNSLTFAESAASRWHNGSSFGNRQTISTSDETSLSFLLIQWSIANGNYLLRRNGTELIQASRTYSFNNSATAAFQIGYRHTNTNAANFSGYIGEIVVFNNQIGTTDRQNVESYLTQKWGLVSSLPGGHLHLTKQAGAITPTVLTKFRMVGIPRFVFASTGLAITHQDGRTWKATANNPGYANYAIGLNSGASMSLNIYAGADVFNSAGGRVALLYNGDTNNAVRHAGYVMWTSTFAANNYDFGWKFVSSGSGYLIYNDYPSIGSAWQVTYDPSQDRVLIQPPGAATYGMVWNITPRVTLAYVYSSY